MENQKYPKAVVYLLALMVLLAASNGWSSRPAQLIAKNEKGWQIRAKTTENSGLLISLKTQSMSLSEKVIDGNFSDLLELRTVSSSDASYAAIEVKSLPRGQGRLFFDYYVLVFRLMPDAAPQLVHKKLIKTEIHDAKGIYNYPDYRWIMRSKKSSTVLLLQGDDQTEEIDLSHNN